jgi:shikimate dehydrogenase
MDAPARVRLGVLGWPVAHSRSPAMQNAALAAVGLENWRYQLLPVPPELFAETVRGLPEVGFVGANVTIPHKVAALQCADSASARAVAIGAANTLRFGEDGAIWADNTDGPGLIEALRARGRGLAGTSAMVLGAGGTARAALWALRDAGIDVRVWNRTPQRAGKLCEELGGRVVAEPEPADLLVQCTAAGLAPGTALALVGALAPAAGGLGNFATVVDFVYGAEPSALLSAAAAAGTVTIDGQELLLRQGALSFELFTGRPAPVDVMAAALRPSA